MKKIGPLSLNLVVACKIFELQRDEKLVDFNKLVTGLDGLVSRSAIPSLLRSLSDWGIIRTDYGQTESGRAGRLYLISNEAQKMIQETYQFCWPRVLKASKKVKK